MLSILSYVYGLSESPPWRSVHSDPFPIFNWIYFLVLSPMSSLYILEIKCLLKASLANMFYHVISSIFILIMVFLAMQKLFNLIYSSLVIFSFLSLVLRDIFAKILLCAISEILLPVFSSKTFMGSQLTFKSFIHLEFILLCGISWWFSFIFLHVLVQFSQHHLLKRLFLCHFMLLPPVSKVIDQWRHGFILGLFMLFLWSMCLFLCQYQTVLIIVAF